MFRLPSYRLLAEDNWIKYSAGLYASQY